MSKKFSDTVPEKAHWNIWNSNSDGILAEFQILVPILVLGDQNKKPEGATKHPPQYRPCPCPPNHPDPSALDLPDPLALPPRPLPGAFGDFT